MAYGDFQDLTRRTASNKTLRDILLKIQNMMISKGSCFSGLQIFW